MKEPPRIEFPCDYPIKVIGVSSLEFRTAVIAIVKSFDPSLTDQKIAFRPSAGGNYESIKVSLVATGADQLASLFEQLKAVPGLKMVL